MNTKVLIVEDETIIAMELEDRLTHLGYAVTGSAASASAAFNSIENERPDIVLMDIHIQGSQDGIETAKQVGIHFNIPVIYLTAYADDATVQRAKITKPFAYLVKPFREDELRAAIEVARYTHDLETQVQEKQQFIEQITGTLPDIVYVVDLKEYKNIFVNRELLNTLGYSLDDIRARNLSLNSVTHPDDLHLVTQASQRVRAAADGEVVEIEYRMKHADESWIWLHTRNTVFKRDREGNVVQFLGIAQDITARKHSEEALMRSEYLLSEAQAVANLGSWDWNILENKTEWSHELYKIFGITPEFLVPNAYEGFLNCIHHLDRERIARVMEQSLATKESFEIEYRIVRPLDGEERFIHSRGRVNSDRNGKIVRMHGSSQDITERKKTDAALLKSQKRYYDLFSNAIVGIFQSTAEGAIVTANTYLATITGYESVDELLNKNTADLYWDSQERSAIMNRYGSQDIASNLEIRWRKKDGSQLWVELNARRVYDESEHLVLFEGFITDITERKQAQDALRESQMQFEGVVNSAFDAIVTINEDQNIILFNSGAERVFNWQASEVIGQPLNLLLPPESINAHHDFVNRYGIANKDTSRLMSSTREVQARRRDGSRFSVETAISKITIQGKNIYTTILRDITEREQAEADIRHLNAKLEQRVKERTAQLASTLIALQAGEERLHYALDATSEGVWDWNVPTGECYFSPHWLEILGYESNDLPQTIAAWELLIHPEDKAVVDAELQAHLKGAISGFAMEHRLRKKSGEYCWVLGRGKVVARAEDGSPLRMVGTNEDVTERRLVTERLRRQNEYLKAMYQLTLDMLGQYDEDTLLQTIVEKAASIAKAPYVNIDILEGGNKLVTRACTPNLSFLIGDFAFQGEDGFLTWEALESGVPMIIEDYSNYEKRRDIFKSVEIHATADIPIKIGDQPIGILSISRSEPNDPFTPEDIQFTVLLTQLTAIALNNLQLYKALTASEEKYRQIYENVNDIIYQTDYHGRITDVSPSIEQWDGYLPEEVIGRQAIEFYGFPEDYYNLESAIENLGRVNDFEVRLKRKSGNVMVVSITAHTIMDANGQPIGTQGVIRDITERKQIENRIANLNTELEVRILERTAHLQSANMLLSALEEAAVVVNRSLSLDDVLDQILEQCRKIIPCRGINLMFLDGEYASISRRIGYEGFGYLERDLEGYKYPLAWSTFEYMITNHKSLLIPNTAGSPHWHVSSVTEWVHSFLGVPLQIDNEVIGFMNASHDESGFFDEQHVSALETLATHAAVAIQKIRLIEELKGTLKKEQLMRAQLVQADKLVALGKMVAVIAHEINNPIQTIKNTFYLLKDQVDPNSPAMEYLDIAATETNRIAELIEQLRETYRPRSKTFTKVDLLHLISDVKIVLEPQLRKKQVEWVQPKAFRPCTVFGVRNNLKQVFINICINAIEAMEADNGGKLTIKFQLSPDRRQIGVEVRNTGPHIPPDILSQLFEPFFTTKGVGTGLGLSISYEIIRHHNGEIKVQNNPDKNVSFIIWLPLLSD